MNPTAAADENSALVLPGYMFDSPGGDIDYQARVGRAGNFCREVQKILSSYMKEQGLGLSVELEDVAKCEGIGYRLVQTQQCPQGMVQLDDIKDTRMYELAEASGEKPKWSDHELDTKKREVKVTISCRAGEALTYEAFAGLVLHEVSAALLAFNHYKGTGTFESYDEIPYDEKFIHNDLIFCKVFGKTEFTESNFETCDLRYLIDYKAETAVIDFIEWSSKTGDKDAYYNPVSIFVEYLDGLKKGLVNTPLESLDLVGQIEEKVKQLNPYFWHSILVFRQGHYEGLLGVEKMISDKIEEEEERKRILESAIRRYGSGPGTRSGGLPRERSSGQYPYV